MFICNVLIIMFLYNLDLRLLLGVDEDEDQVFFLVCVCVLCVCVLNAYDCLGTCLDCVLSFVCLCMYDLCRRTLI